MKYPLLLEALEAQEHGKQGPDSGLDASVSSIFYYYLEPPAAFVEALAAVSPPRERLSWLECHWVPGPEHDPIQRFALYEVMPAGYVPRHFHEQLHYAINFERRTEHTFEEWRIISRYIRTGELLQTFWLVQGEGGGHKYRFSEPEQKLLRLLGLPDEPPEPGELPFAWPDQRTIDAVEQWSILRLGYTDLKRGHVEVRRQMAKDFRRRVCDWLSKQVSLDNVWRDVSLEDLPRVDNVDRVNEERLALIERDYIETGRINPHREAVR